MVPNAGSVATLLVQGLGHCKDSINLFGGWNIDSARWLRCFSLRLPSERLDFQGKLLDLQRFLLAERPELFCQLSYLNALEVEAAQDPHASKDAGGRGDIL